MEIIHSLADFRTWRASVKDRRVGFVPTMGALHEGHVSLVERSTRENEVSVVSIYVNPTQFDKAADLSKYPETLAADCALLAPHQVDAVLAPDFAQMYPDNFRYQVVETSQSRELCGAHRPGHFTGVLTVVMKLLNLVAPHRAYFGQKDYQQFQLIRDMAAAFFMNVEIIDCPTVRENDGLAMSSRNRNLTSEARQRAPLIYELCRQSLPDSEVAARLVDAGFAVDYVVSRGERRFVAARTGAGALEVRLIDNVLLTGEPE